MTEWDEFRALDLARVRALMEGAVIVDLRNIYRSDELERFGFAHTAIGRSGGLSERRAVRAKPSAHEKV